MGTLSNIARPYANAAFEYAKEKHALPAWKAFLESAALVATDASIARILSNPISKHSAIYNLFYEVLSSLIDKEKENFLRIISQHKRFIVLPEIARLFNESYANDEKISTVRVITAIDIKEDFRNTLIKALSKRTSCKVTLQCEVDPTILGGAIIHIGDRVIDGSIRGKLTRLLEFSLR